MDEDDQAPIDPRGYQRSYEVVAARLERRIRAGEIALHQPLPSEPALAEWYGVSRSTVRSAIRVLTQRGIVEVVRGKGTYVTWTPDAGLAAGRISHRAPARQASQPAASATASRAIRMASVSPLAGNASVYRSTVHTVTVTPGAATRPAGRTGDSPPRGTQAVTS